MALVDLSRTKVTILSGTGTSPVIVCFFHCSLVNETPIETHLTFTSLPCSTVIDLRGLSLRWSDNLAAVENENTLILIFYHNRTGFPRRNFYA